MEQLIKILLAALFLICLADLPYGYYQLVRFVALIAFAILAYKANANGEKIALIIYIGLALLFQPFFKVALGRRLWNIVDVIVAVGLILSLFQKTVRKRN